MTRRWKYMLCGILSLVLLTAAACPVFAKEAQTAVEVNFKACDFSPEQPDTDLYCYQVAEYDENSQLVFTKEFEAYETQPELFLNANASEQQELAETLAAYVKDKEISGTAHRVNVTENYLVSGLTDGLYLFVIDSVETETEVYKFVPALFFLPGLDESGIRQETVSITPKHSMETRETETKSPETPTTEKPTSPEPGTVPSAPNPPSGERFPQTGMRLWVLELLIGIGCIMLITAWGAGRRRPRKTKVMGIALIAGICCFGTVAGMYGHTLMEERQAAVGMQDIISDIRSEQPAVMEDVQNLNAGAKRPDSCPADENGYIGILEIPDLSLELPISSSCTLDTLKYTPGCLDGCPWNGTFILGAHNYRSQFGRISGLEIGSTVTFTDIEGIRYTYQVADITEAEPTEVQAVRDAGHDMALFTCNWSGARRTIVYCDLK